MIVCLVLCTMPRQRKRGVGGRATGAGLVRRSGRSVSVTNSDTSGDGKQHCGSCSREVLDGCIGCDRCETWVHGTEMCAGLPSKVIEAILEHDGQGISYFCLKCRIARASELEKSPSQRKDDLSSGTLAQIFQQMQGLCSAVAELTAQVKALSSSPRPGPPAQDSVTHQHHSDTCGTASNITYAAALTRQPHTTTPHLDQTPQTTEYRQIVKQELRELHEREKRKESVVIHGLTSTSTSGVSAEFGELTRKMMGKQVLLSDVVPIPGHTGLYRGKILDEIDRKLVLDKAKSLKGTDYDRVYIRRDLTYNQRSVLKARRDAYHSERQQRQQVPAAATGECPAPPSQESQELGVPRLPPSANIVNPSDVPQPRSEPVPGGAAEALGKDSRIFFSRKLTETAPSNSAPGVPAVGYITEPETTTQSN